MLHLYRDDEALKSKVEQLDAELRGANGLIRHIRGEFEKQKAAFLKLREAYTTLQGYYDELGRAHENLQQYINQEVSRRCQAVLQENKQLVSQVTRLTDVHVEAVSQLTQERDDLAAKVAEYESRLSRELQAEQEREDFRSANLQAVLSLIEANPDITRSEAVFRLAGLKQSRSEEYKRWSALVQEAMDSQPKAA